MAIPRMIELVDVRKAFNQGRPNEFWAVRGVSLSLEAQHVTVLRGPSGSGKTTLMTLIGCLARPTAGRVRLRGRDVSGMSERFLTGLRRTTFGFVFQQFNLVRGLSVAENVMLPAYPLGIARRELLARAHSLLESLELAEHAQSRVEWLSGGQAQRAAIARALVNDPEVILADEPTANLDTELSRRFLGIVRDLKDQGKTLLMTSHDPLICEAPEVDRVVNLRDGELA
jgi:putative ABC transport system ATP-binding protein